MIEGFACVTRIFKSFCQHQELEVLATAIEKHGSLEWSACKEGNINRYISLALTSEPELLEGPAIYTAEVWAEADDSLHFTRRMSSTFRIAEESLASERFRKQLTEALSMSWQQAESLKQSDLTESYIGARR